MISTEEFAERRSRAAEMANAEGLEGLLVCSRGGGTLDRFGDVFYLANYYTSFPYIPDLPHVWSARAHTFVVLSAKGDCILVTDAPNDGQTALAEENVIYTDLVLDGVLDAMQRLEMESGSVGLVGGGSRVTIGDTTRDSQARASVISWSDFRGGIGVERMEGAKDADRAWWSTCSLRYKRHLVLPAKTRGGVSNSDTTGESLDIIQEYNGELYCIYSNKKIYKFNSGNDGFGSELNELPAQATDSLEVRIGGKLYLVVAYGTGYMYVKSKYEDDNTATKLLESDDTYNDNTSTDSNAPFATKFLTFWDDKLWGIGDDGQLWYSTTLGTEALDAKLPLPSGHVTDLFVARNASGNPVIYAMTKEGLYAHDFSEGKFKLEHILDNYRVGNKRKWQ